MVGRKLEMSTLSGSNYLTLAGKSRFRYQVALGDGGGGGFETRLYVYSSFAVIVMGKWELVALLSLSSWCLVIVVWLFLAVR